MDTSKMKNMIVLKNLPSNLIEEAIVIVKDTKKIKKVQYVDVENRNKLNSKEIEKRKEQKKKSYENNSKDYIVKEAEMIIDNYITNLEAKSPKWKNDMKKLQKRYKSSLKINVLLGFATIISLIISII